MGRCNEKNTVVWKITPLIAEYLADCTGALWASGILGPAARVLELGCGVSGLVGLALAPAVARYVLTDQPYVSRLVERNIAENRDVGASAGQRKSAQKRKGKGDGKAAHATRQNLSFTPLDWERDEVTPRLLAGGNDDHDGDDDDAKDDAAPGFDVILACDCIYNEALIEPLVQTCADACRLRQRRPEGDTSHNEDDAAEPTVCVVAQQLRDPDIFEAWIRAFHARFRAWRVPDDALSGPLRESPGFVVHVGVLR